MKRFRILACVAVGVVASGCSAASTAESAGSGSRAVTSAPVGVLVSSTPATAASGTVVTSGVSSPFPTCSAVAFSLVSDRGGQSSPLEAAVWLAQHGSVPGVPKSGWKEVSAGKAEATVLSGGVHLHVIQGSDQTWQVDRVQYYCP